MEMTMFYRFFKHLVWVAWLCIQYRSGYGTKRPWPSHIFMTFVSNILSLGDPKYTELSIQSFQNSLCGFEMTKMINSFKTFI